MLIIEATINTLLNRGWTPPVLDAIIMAVITLGFFAFLVFGGPLLPDWLNG